MFIGAAVGIIIIVVIAWFSRKGKRQRETNNQPPGPTN